MLGLMQRYPLLISSLIKHAARHRGGAEVISNLGGPTLHRTTYAEVERRSRRLARALGKLGVELGDRVATLAWNDFRHLELYYGVSGMGAVCHTVNPRLSADDIAFIMTDAQDCILFADPSFAALVAEIAPPVSATVRAVVLLTDAAGMKDVALPPGMRLYCYETLLAEADEDYAWPEFDENTASALCYTSGTTGGQRRAVQPSGDHAAHLRRQFRRDVRHSLGRSHLARRVDVSRLRLGVALLRNHGRSDAHSAGPASRWGVSLWDARKRASDDDGRRANDLARTARASARLERTAHLSQAHAGRRVGAASTAHRRIHADGRQCRTGLGHDRDQPDRHLQFADASERPPGRRRSRSPAPEARPRHLRHGHQDRRCRGPRTALGWQGVRRFSGAWPLGVPRISQSRRGGRGDSDGWLRTGDVCTIDPDGCAEIVDRSKDVIKSGGEWISSIALENIAVSHPAVAEAAIIAARHPKWQERPLLLVVPRAGMQVDKDELLAMFAGKVAKWWLPDDVLTLEELPHTATGKLNKLALRARYQDYLMEAARSQG